jgi:hypothetical protein
MLGLPGDTRILVADMIDVEVYKCLENVEWPSFTLLDVYSMNDVIILQRIRGRSDCKKFVGLYQASLTCLP